MNTSKNSLFSQEMISAIKDYRFLIDKGYPEKSLIELVGGRYSLNKHQRELLYRGIAPGHEDNKRQKCIIQSIEDCQQPLLIDGSNVLVTLSTYLSGLLVFVSSDGFLRDAAGIYSGSIKKEIIIKAFELLCSYLKDKNCRSAVFVMDKPHKSTASLSEEMKSICSTTIPEMLIILEYNADKYLESQEAGCICSSDSAIIERGSLKSFDLAFNIIQYHFKPDIPDLRSYLVF